MLWGNTGTKRKSPFGLPDVMTPGGGYGGGTPAGNPGADMPAQQAPRGDKTRRIIGLASEAIGGLLGNGPGLYAKSVLQRQESEQEAAQYERRRADAYADWKQKEEWRLANDKPDDDSFTRTLTAAGIDPASPEGIDLYRQRATSMANPVQWLTGADGVARPMPKALPTKPVGQLRPMGGQPAQGQRPFDVNQRWQNGAMTSGRRTPEGNRLVGGVPDSAHLRGDAFDLDGPNLGALRSEAQARYPDAKILVHDGHVHVQKPGLNVPYYGKRGTRGLR